MKRIALVGTHGVGKTTVFEELKKLHPEFCYFGESVRHQMPAFGYDSPYQIVDEIGIGALEVLNLNYWSVIDSGNSLLKDDATVITDRSAIDNYAYFLALKTSEDEKHGDLVLRMAKHYASLIDLFIYFPIAFPLQGDNMRPSDFGLQRNVNEKLLVTFQLFNIDQKKIYHLQNSTVEDRVIEIEDVLSNFRG